MSLDEVTVIIKTCKLIYYISVLFGLYNKIFRTIIRLQGCIAKQKTYLGFFI